MVNTMTTYETDISDALKAALMDSSYLITPRARERALLTLDAYNDPVVNAARTLLLDGGGQQGTNPVPWMLTLTRWAECVDILGEVFFDGDLSAING